MNKVKLDKRWKEILFAAAGFGPNLLMVLMMAYFTDAVMPAGLNADVNFWSYGGVTIVSLVIFPILWTISRCFDGIVDIPLAALTDTLKNKTGKRYITILISFLPMLVSFVLCWIPVFGKGADLTDLGRVGNSIWIIFWALIFFASYTLALITFYGSLSEVCDNQTQRARVSAYKSVFDTISYALVYAAFPAVFKMLDFPIWKVALVMSPLMVTILIPYCLMKKTDEPIGNGDEAQVPFGTSIALTVKSKPFMKWLAVNCVAFFGLQMFLVAQNTLISGVMNLGAGYAAILNTCAFAPVPLMLYFFNKLRKKIGIRTVYQTCLLCFAISIFSFNLGSQYFWGDALMPKLIIGAVGGIIGSWAIGAFFMVPYLIPTVIASVEEEVTKKNHSAMYFAVQAFATSIVGAIASSLIYNYVKLWTSTNSAGYEWKCGVSLIPLIVSVFCIAGFFLCFTMPKKYSSTVIYSDIKSSLEKENKSLLKKKENLLKKRDTEIEVINELDITEEEKDTLRKQITAKTAVKIAKLMMDVEKNNEILGLKFNPETSKATEEKTGKVEKESVISNIFLFILTGGIFGIIDRINIYKKIKKIGVLLNCKDLVLFILSFIIPFVSIASDLNLMKKLNQFDKSNKASKAELPVAIITGMILPLWMNLVDASIMNNKINNIAYGENLCIAKIVEENILRAPYIANTAEQS